MAFIEPPQRQRDKRNAVTHPSALWPNARIPYVISSEFSGELHIIEECLQIEVCMLNITSYDVKGEGSEAMTFSSELMLQRLVCCTKAFLLSKKPISHWCLKCHPPHI